LPLPAIIADYIYLNNISKHKTPSLGKKWGLDSQDMVTSVKGYPLALFVILISELIYY